ncbi:MAG: DUF1284 domain-containing protein [Sarcina sp.]|nr:DUF1284 domain-containing protein [Sarcina sp.]
MTCEPVSAPACTRKGSPVLLRPHHLLCLQNFRGKGYSPGFVRRMTEIHALVSGEAAASDKVRPHPSGDLIPDPSAGKDRPHPVLLVSGRDVLCAACPHCGETDCTSANPSRFDALVLSRTGLRIGQRLEEGMESPELPAMNSDMPEACCPGCKWFEICMRICLEKKPEKACCR